MFDFRFGNPVIAHVGRGKAFQIGEYVSANRVFLVCDPVVRNLPCYDRIKDSLGARIAGEYCDIPPNPTADKMETASSAFSASAADAVVAVGGGSTLDAAKVVAVLGGDPGRLKSYMDGSAKIAQRAPFLALMPTTAGTGSEMTNVAVVTDPRSHKKIPLVGDPLYGDIAVIDPELSRTMPFRVAASSGIDSLCHAIEALWNVVATPPSDALATEAIRYIMPNLESACDGDADAGEKMTIGSYLAGFAFNQTRTTVCHAISYDLTGRFGIEHGIACAITLVPFLRFNREAIKGKLDLIGGVCGYGGAEGFISAVETLYRRLRLPAKLSEYKIRGEDVDSIADAALQVPSTRLNPRRIAREDLVGILHSVV